MNSMKLMKIMKLGISPSGILAFCLLGLIPKSQAQTFIVHNFDQPSATTSSESAGGDTWQATSFRTDSVAYTLDSVTIAHNALSYTGSAFIRIYSDSADMPGSEVGQFANTWTTDTSFDPNRRTFQGRISLEADTTYWLVFGATDDGGFFEYTRTNSDDQTGQWEIGNDILRSANSGTSWPLDAANQSIMFGMQATIIPEPSTYAIVGGMCLVGFVAFRRIRIAKIAKSS